MKTGDKVLAVNRRLYQGNIREEATVIYVDGEDITVKFMAGKIRIVKVYDVEEIKCN